MATQTVTIEVPLAEPPGGHKQSTITITLAADNFRRLQKLRGGLLAAGAVIEGTGLGAPATHPVKTEEHCFLWLLEQLKTNS